MTVISDADRLRDRLAALHRIVARSTGSVERDREALLGEALAALGLEYGAVLRFSGDTAYPVTSLTAAPEPHEPVNRPTPASQLLAAAVWRAGETIAVANLTADPRFVDHLQVRERDVRAYVGTPIRVTGEGGYVLTMGANSALEDFAPGDLAYVELLAALFAQSLRDENQTRSIERLTHHDRLTGFALEERLRARSDELSAARRPYAVVAVHIDIARILADHEYGLGAAIVAAAARRIDSMVQPGNFVVYRGGEIDFVALGEDVPAAEAESLAATLHRALAAPFYVEGREIALEPSLGVVQAAEREQTDALLARLAASGHALPAVEDAATKRRRRLLDDLRGVADRNELELYVQPVVHVAGGALCGIEALVRWRHPDLGLLQPDEFIPLAEENETIVALGMWVLRGAAAIARRFADGGRELAVALNVASAQLQDPAFIDRLRLATREAGVKPSALELEITETAALRDIAAATSVLAECRGLGVRVALDDFGTGYSSLSYLRDLPSDIVKIDRSFVGALESDPRATAIASATIVLAHRLGRIVQAEGVETDAQRAWLLDEKCDRAQGFLYGIPVPSADFERRLAS
ncbi:MAG TPA: EAL domain-containing protein [Candidatus Elarobacter sp.]|jgi:EAL domain-containing protein (putative c-di-GMP-specific phosphodiesterase class I)